MAESYDKNGYNSSDFKRNASNQDSHEQDGEGVKLNEKAGEYMRELLSEKIKLDSSKYPISCRLIDAEVAKLQNTGRIPIREFKFVDVYREKPVKVVTKVLLPIKEFPKFNFVGKLLGPKGNTLKQLQEETMCKMAVLGRGSMRDRQKEEEYRNSLDPKYAHLTDDLHLEISALAPPAEAHARLAYALAEAKKYMLPDPAEMMMQRGPGAPPPPPMRDVFERGPRPGGRPPPPRMPPLPPSRGGPPSKSKVISILDRARSAMESPYGYDDPYAMPEMPPVRGPPPRAAPPQEADYYGYERGGHERYYEDDYYKDDMSSREYKGASAREVGTRRVAPQARHFARASPYTRTSKESYSGPKKQRGH